MTRHDETTDIIGAWVKWGMLSGTAIGGIYGTALVPIFGTVFGAFIGLAAGDVTGLIDGLLLAWLRPGPGRAPLAAAAFTELILLPVQIWLWFVIHTPTFLPAVATPAAVSVGTAALLGRWLPPGAGQPADPSDPDTGQLGPPDRDRLDRRVEDSGEAR